MANGELQRNKCYNQPQVIRLSKPSPSLSMMLDNYDSVTRIQNPKPAEIISGKKTHKKNTQNWQLWLYISLMHFEYTGWDSGNVNYIQFKVKFYKKEMKEK